MNQFSIPQLFAIWTLPVLFAITIHEVAHGWVANKFGDPTAKMMGRLTLNPIKHIDFIGTIIVPAILLILGGFIFGWAKPVPVNYNNLKRPRRDMALVAAAGPITNFLMALGWAVVVKIGAMLGADSIGFWLFYMGQAGVMINLVLMVLNLIPIPPLDGSRVVTSLLSPSAAFAYNKLERWGFFILLILLALGLLSYILLPPVRFLAGFIFSVFGIQ